VDELLRRRWSAVSVNLDAQGGDPSLALSCLAAARGASDRSGIHRAL